MRKTMFCGCVLLKKGDRIVDVEQCPEHLGRFRGQSEEDYDSVRGNPAGYAKTAELERKSWQKICLMSMGLLIILSGTILFAVGAYTLVNFTPGNATAQAADKMEKFGFGGITLALLGAALFGRYYWKYTNAKRLEGRK